MGGFNSKFVSKTLCILLLYYGHPRGWLINYYQETSQLVRGSLILLRWHQTSVWKQVDLPVAENRSVLTEKGSPLYHNILTNLLRYLDPQDSWGKWRMRKQCIPGRLSQLRAAWNRGYIRTCRYNYRSEESIKSSYTTVFFEGFFHLHHQLYRLNPTSSTVSPNQLGLNQKFVPVSTAQLYLSASSTISLIKAGSFVSWL